MIYIDRAQLLFCSLLYFIVLHVIILFYFIFCRSFSYKYTPLSLIGKQWPANVNPSAREQFLSPEDFLKVFNMTKEEFNNEAKFVRLRMKKDVGLF